MKYRLYLDESGDHTTSDPNITGKRYLGLLGVAIKQDADYCGFRDSLDDLRRKYFGEDPPVLHREEIMARSGDFSCLRDNETREGFESDLLEVFRSTQCWIVAVVIDKHEHRKATYRKLVNPYHWGLHAVLERYCGYLDHCNITGDVMAESRGRVEDMALRDVYENVYSRGTRWMLPGVAQKTLTSKEMKIKPKHAGIHGLQLADLLAYPLTRDVLVAYGRIANLAGLHCEKTANVAQEKYNKHLSTGRIKGYGKVLLA
jgi:hypothetical protein